MKMKTKYLALFSASVLLVTGVAFCVLLGCGGSTVYVEPAPPPAPPPPPPEVRPPMAMLNTPETTIQANDNSFVMQTNMRLATPFESPTCPTNPTTETFDEALNGGARPVMVTTPHHGTPLYGLLSFCPLPYGTTGPASRLHLVQVPQQYVDATADGLISVVFEPVITQSTTLCEETCSTPYNYQCDDGGENSLYNHCALGTDCNDCGPRTSAAGSVPAWILYLSRQPFPQLGGPAGPAPAPVGAVQRPPMTATGTMEEGAPEIDPRIQDAINQVESERGTPLTPEEKAAIEKALKKVKRGKGK